MIAGRGHCFEARLCGDHTFLFQFVKAERSLLRAIPSLMLLLLSIFLGLVFVDRGKLAEDLTFTKLRHELFHLTDLIEQLLHLLVIRSRGGRASCNARHRRCLRSGLRTQVGRLSGGSKRHPLVHIFGVQGTERVGNLHLLGLITTIHLRTISADCAEDLIHMGLLESTDICSQALAHIQETITLGLQRRYLSLKSNTLLVEHESFMLGLLQLAAHLWKNLLFNLRAILLKFIVGKFADLKFLLQTALLVCHSVELATHIEQYILGVLQRLLTLSGVLVDEGGQGLIRRRLHCHEVLLLLCMFDFLRHLSNDS